jgi:hypothetical protein
MRACALVRRSGLQFGLERAMAGRGRSTTNSGAALSAGSLGRIPITIRNPHRIGGNSTSKSVAIPIPEKSFIPHPKIIDFGLQGMRMNARNTGGCREQTRCPLPAGFYR